MVSASSTDQSVSLLAQTVTLLAKEQPLWRVECPKFKLMATVSTLVSAKFKFLKLFHACFALLLSRKTFTQQAYQHVGMSKKPLMPYNANAVRS